MKERNARPSPRIPPPSERRMRAGLRGGRNRSKCVLLDDHVTMFRLPAPDIQAMCWKELGDERGHSPR